MAIEIRTARSIEMEKNAATVGRMTGGIAFNADSTAAPREVIGGVAFKLFIKAARVIVNIGYSFMPREKHIKIRKLSLDGITGEMSVPQKQTSDNIILYIHGGGFVSGSAKATRAYCSMLAKYSGCRVVSINYSLAPEKVWPSAVDDCTRAYLALRRQYPDAKLCLTGESAGGNLVLTTTIRLLRTGAKAPECLVPHSPVCDFADTMDHSYYENKDITVAIGAINSLASLYCPGADLKEPELSPFYFDDFAKFPPTTMDCDFNETLRADVDAVYRKMEEAGAQVDLIIMKNAFHAFAPIGTGAPETMELMLDNIRFMRKCWGESQ